MCSVIQSNEIQSFPERKEIIKINPDLLKLSVCQENGLCFLSLTMSEGKQWLTTSLGGMGYLPFSEVDTSTTQ